MVLQNILGTLPEDQEDLEAWDVKFVGGLKTLLVTTRKRQAERNGGKEEMNCKSEQVSFDWEMIDFEL